jgi:hypothetical protein
LTAENFEVKDDSKSSKSLKCPQGAQIVTSMLSKNGAVLCYNCLFRISVSQDLAESEVYKRCISLLGDYGRKKSLSFGDIIIRKHHFSQKLLIKGKLHMPILVVNDILLCVYMRLIQNVFFSSPKQRIHCMNNTNHLGWWGLLLCS